MRTRLVVWVEGASDQSFVKRVIQPKLEAKYARVIAKTYRESETRVINQALAQFEHDRFDRLVFVDRDSSPCIAHCKEKLTKRYPALKHPEIIVVSAMIESWYLAGVSDECAGAYNIRLPASTDSITKQDLVRMLPPQFAGPRPFLLELLNRFDWDAACRRNQSFAYLHRRIEQLTHA